MPTNEERAERINKVLTFYSTEVLGDHTRSDDIIDLLTDLRHYCDDREIDIYAHLDTSYLHYIEEKKEERG